jgi:hypothetical protein
MCDILLPLKFFQDLGTRSLASSGPYLRGIARSVHHRTILTTIFGQKSRNTRRSSDKTGRHAAKWFLSALFSTHRRNLAEAEQGGI